MLEYNNNEFTAIDGNNVLNRSFVRSENKYTEDEDKGRMAAKESASAGARSDGISRQNSGSLDLDSVLLSRALRFVEKLEDQHVCPSCGRVVLNPHQTGCGHIFCFRCIRALLENNTTAKCPIDNSLIKSKEVFQDNCCKREILNLEIHCTNSPDCSHTVPLCRLQDHLKACQYEPLQCSNPGCADVLPRRDLREHSEKLCGHRLELCPHCHKPYTLIQIKDHEATVCPEVQVPCPNECTQMVKRHKLEEHFSDCPEVETDCVYRRYGCCVREKRVRVQAHESAALNEHMLLVLENNTKLEKQIDSLQQSMVLRHQELQERSSVVSSLEREVQPLVHQVAKSDQVISAVQRSLEEQKDRVSTVQLQLQQLSRAFGQDSGRTEGSLDTLRQQVSVIDGLKERLGVLEDNYMRHSRLLNIHVDQLQRNDERFQELESTSYNGKLIWKIRDYHKRKEAAVSGHAPLILSAPFYTGRSGYKLSARAYLNGDGPGRGTHLSLFVVLMRGDFDALLPWPFRQGVTLTVLDQSGGRSDVSDSFRPDPASSSFQRPVSEMNVASGFPRFVSHGNLEAPKNARSSRTTPSSSRSRWTWPAWTTCSGPGFPRGFPFRVPTHW
ncbi:hypothetical protein AAFF_G00074920 [Aldrovandia affinis]|uniref:TNF receptor-associated factor n=1 Tax=Aldrovandia affinis TaxID=143900 RepID=A0AAD7WCU8_9TELE|nr:hypothetical protein AAFF_G00074920 [Aldrovandia affinis]